MAKELIITTEKFKEIPVRVVQYNDQGMIPLNDVADAIGLDRSGMRKIISRNLRLFEKFVGKVVMPSPKGGVQETTCLTRDGITGILVKVNLARIKDAEKQNMVFAFQEWAINALSKLIKGEVVQPPMQKLSVPELVREHLQIADAMVNHAHVDRGIATSVALALVEYQTGMDLSAYKAMIRKDRAEPAATLTPTQVGQELGGITPQTINRILRDLGYQEWIGDGWSLTERGRLYAEVFPVTIHSKSKDIFYPRYQIKWQPVIVDKLRKAFEPRPDPKQGLLLGEVGT